MIIFSHRRGHRPDYFLIALVFVVALSGLVILASASSELGKIRFNDASYYLKHQILYGVSFGLLGFAAAYFIPYANYKKWAVVLLGATIALLVLVLTPLGTSSGGASRWLGLGPIVFQPSEFLKITFVIYVAAWLSNRTMNRVRNFSAGAVPFLVICGVVSGLLIAQPATSTVAILIAAGCMMYFESGVPIRHLAAVGAIGATAFALVVWFTPYRLARVLTFFNPHKDTGGSSYQINQALIAIGSGKLTGVGYGNSSSKVNYLPAPLDDSIFAIAAQELGFIGAGVLVIFFAMLVFRLLYLARRAPDRFGRAVLVGFASIIALQSIVNMGAISGLLPLTGIPLPFVSYGGTALAVFLTMMGIAANISKYS